MIKYRDSKSRIVANQITVKQRKTMEMVFLVLVFISSES